MSIYHFETPASVETVAPILDWAEGAALRHLELGSEALNALIVCLQELVANVALHAKADSGALQVRVGLRFEPEEVAVLVEDNGRPFDLIKDAPAVVDTDLASASLSGRGVRIVRELATGIFYKREGDWNRVSLKIA